MADRVRNLKYGNAGMLLICTMCAAAMVAAGVALDYHHAIMRYF